MGSSFVQDFLEEKLVQSEYSASPFSDQVLSILQSEYTKVCLIYCWLRQWKNICFFRNTFAEWRIEGRKDGVLRTTNLRRVQVIKCITDCYKTVCLNRGLMG